MCYLWANAWQLLHNEAQQLQSNTKHRTTAGLKSNKVVLSGLKLGLSQDKVAKIPLLTESVENIQFRHFLKKKKKSPTETYCSLAEYFCTSFEMKFGLA